MADNTSLEIIAYVDPVELKADVTINPMDLDTEVMEHASMFVHYATKAASARAQFDRIKLLVDVLTSKLSAEHRETLATDGKKTTEAMIEGSLKADPRYLSLQMKVIEARFQYDVASEAREAYSQKKDTLLAVAVDKRKEREGQMRVYGAKSDIENARSQALGVITGQAA